MNLPFSNTTFYENLHILSNDATHDTLKCNFAFTRTRVYFFLLFVKYTIPIKSIQKELI